MSSLADLITDRLQPALVALLTAFDYAADSGADRWEFAVEMPELLREPSGTVPFCGASGAKGDCPLLRGRFSDQRLALGLTVTDLRWLIRRGLAEHAKETTIPGDPARTFRSLAPTSFPPDACLALTPDGASKLRALLSASFVDRSLQRDQFANGEPLDPSPPPGPEARVHSPAPIWDPLRRELRYRGQVIKRYRVPAPNQELVLAAFQEEDWPEFIDDPLPPVDDIDPKYRLQVTIKALNRNQVTRPIRFHGNGNGLQVHWAAAQLD
jgi:hypothetical protein